MAMTQFEKAVVKELHEIGKELHQLNRNISRNQQLELRPAIDVEGLEKELSDRLAQEERK